MTMLHYPNSLLSSFFNNQYCIGFISVLFNTLRETMQACGFAGGGKQCTNLNDIDTSNINNSVESYDITDSTIIKSSTEPNGKSVHLKFTNLSTIAPDSKNTGPGTATSDITGTAEFRLKPASTAPFKIPKVLLKDEINTGYKTINGIIAPLLLQIN